MGFFSKLFRRKDKGGRGRKGKVRGGKRGSDDKNNREPSPTTTDLVAPVEEDVPAPPAAAAPRRGTGGAGPDVSDGAQRVVLSPRNAPAALAPQHATSLGTGSFEPAASSSPTSNKSKSRSTGPVDLDESEVESDNSETENRKEPPLSSQRLEEFERQSSAASSSSPANAPTPVFTMDDPKIRFSAGQMREESNSDAESSSFNLSTDAEDTEYENLKKRGVLPLDVANLSTVSTPTTTYNTDGETSVFPNLHTDDEGTTTEKETDHEIRILALSKKSEDSSDVDVRPWNSNPHHMPGGSLSISTSALPTSPASAVNGDARDFLSAGSTSYSNGSAGFDSNNNGNGFNSSFPGPRRNFTSPKKQQHSKGSSSDFANFADFNNVSFPGDSNWKDPTGAHPATNGSGAGKPQQQVAGASAAKRYDEAERLLQQRSAGQRPTASATGSSASSSLAIQTDTNLTELLAQAKSKSSSRRTTSQRSTSNSVNSAPAITAAYLRQHHNLKSRSERFSDSGGRSVHEAGTSTSVTDIIHSLEAANASRKGGSSSSRHPRTASRDGDSLHSRESARSAKERLRRRREGQRRASSPDSSDSEEASENWLFDGVTGALGPRGIAADLESLSGRSNRSRSSGGGRSHKSHRSHRSHRSSRRRHKNGSGDSVSSHGSRRTQESRRSRGSRYSHRSARSYISQMSEQSRSVANDLLRLEMQLAMVGSGGDNDTAAKRPASVSGTQPSAASSWHSSRNSHRNSSRRTTNTTPRRTRMTVLAPPGKLGIILANKADAKGTVVSGVRTSSVLAEKISPGDRIVAIDGEDVSLMTVSEITTIMARKSDFERTLTVLTTPKQHHTMDRGEPVSPRGGSGANEYEFSSAAAAANHRYTTSSRN